MGEREEARSRILYNKESRTLDMGNLRTSDYKYNKHIYLPEAENADKEALHEVRRKEQMKAFTKVQEELKRKVKRSKDKLF